MIDLIIPYFSQLHEKSLINQKRIIQDKSKLK